MLTGIGLLDSVTKAFSKPAKQCPNILLQGLENNYATFQIRRTTDDQT